MDLERAFDHKPAWKDRRQSAQERGAAASTAIALFGVLTAKAKGDPLPEGVAYGVDGKPTTDPAQALEGGAIATFGGVRTPCGGV